MLRLLTKNEIDKAKAIDKSREIAEGLKISRKVDNLRELAANEEQMLEKFRAESLAAISKEIEELTEKRDLVASEINELRTELRNETTLSREERQNLEKLKKTLEEREVELDKKQQKLNSEEIELAILLKESQDTLARRKTHEETAKNLHMEAERRESNAKELLDKAKTMELQAIRLKESTEQALSLRENEIAVKESEIKRKEEENLKVSKGLEAEKIRVADREKTLEREIQRIRQNRL